MMALLLVLGLTSETMKLVLGLARETVRLARIAGSPHVASNDLATGPRPHRSLEPGHATVSSRTSSLFSRVFNLVYLIGPLHRIPLLDRLFTPHCLLASLYIQYNT